MIPTESCTLEVAVPVPCVPRSCLNGGCPGGLAHGSNRSQGTPKGRQSHLVAGSRMSASGTQARSSVGRGVWLPRRRGRRFSAAKRCGRSSCPCTCTRRAKVLACSQEIVWPVPVPPRPPRRLCEPLRQVLLPLHLRSAGSAHRRTRRSATVRHAEIAGLLLLLPELQRDHIRQRTQPVRMRP